MATLGLSEVAWSHGKTAPHWVYFLEGRTVFTSPAIVCRKDDCELHYHKEDAIPFK